MFSAIHCNLIVLRLWGQGCPIAKYFWHFGHDILSVDWYTLNFKWCSISNKLHSAEISLSLMGSLTSKLEAMSRSQSMLAHWVDCSYYSSSPVYSTEGADSYRVSYLLLLVTLSLHPSLLSALLHSNSKSDNF